MIELQLVENGSSYDRGPYDLDWTIVVKMFSGYLD